MAQTKFANSLQMNQAALVDNLNPLDPNYNQWMDQARSVVGGQDQTAIAILYGQMQRQAAMMSFIDVFYFLMTVVLVVSPLVFLMRPKKNESAPKGAGH